MRDYALFYLNGTRHEVGGDSAGLMLADWLRVERGLSGTKVVCAEGDCGACSVLRYVPRRGAKGKPLFLPVNSCILTVAQMDGSSLVTVDALARESELSPVQGAMRECHGSQCGFCTPGFVMALTGLVEKKLRAKSLQEGRLGVQETKNALTGNLCRCTGYQPILDAARSIDLALCESVAERFYSKAQEKDLLSARSKPVTIEGAEFRFHAPKSPKAASLYLKKNRDARIVSGATDLGVVHNKRKLRLDHVVSFHLLDRLDEIKVASKRVRVGARVTLSELRRAIREPIPEFARFLDLFASPQIKNVATLVGNLANGSPIGDTPPFLLVAKATVFVAGAKSARKLPLEEFYLGYRKLALKPGEWVESVEFDVPKPAELLRLAKVSQRKDLDISAVNAALRVQWKGAPSDRLASRVLLAMGGIGATPLRLPRTEAALTGAVIDAATVERAVETLQSEITPISDLRGTQAFRRVVAENLLRSFFRTGEA
jgi:xanthine dehydrogenase small subunit